MAKKVKFPLDMGNDVMVRSIDELKENYNAEKLTEYFLNGKLLTWLEDRYYDEAAEQVRELSEQSDSNPAAKLGAIFGIETEEEVDVEALEIRREKLEKLRKITADDEIIKNVDFVAFSQEELGDLLDEEADVIYLCGENFHIPLSVKNVRYVGVNDPVVTVSGKGDIDLEANGIIIEQCEFSEDTKTRIVGKTSEKDDGIPYTSDDDFDFKDRDDGSKELRRYKGLDTIVKIPNYVKRISINAFRNCKNLERIIIPDSVEDISDKAFLGCENLKYINIPNGVVCIERFTFYGCKSLTDIIIPEGIKIIESNAFCNCENLVSINLPESISRISQMAFYGCTNLRSVKLTDKMRTIENRTFYGCKNLLSITIPEGITKIDKFAFYGCTNLKDVVIPKSVAKIGDNAFKNVPKNQITCSNSIAYPESDDDVYYEDFDIEVNDGLVSIVRYKGEANVVAIPEGIDEIGRNAFEECDMKEIDMSYSSVNKIQQEAFQRCENLKIVKLSDYITEIGDSAFAFCINLKHINIPYSVTQIHSWAFQMCKSLESIEINGNIDRIPHNIFDGCESLKDVYIPDDVEYIDYNAFEGCTSLTEIELPYSLYRIAEQAFERCENLENIVLPDGIRYIGNKAFKNCTNLSEVYIPDKIRGIGNDAFKGCKKIEVTYNDEIYNYDDVESIYTGDEY